MLMFPNLDLPMSKYLLTFNILPINLCFTEFLLIEWTMDY